MFAEVVCDSHLSLSCAVHSPTETIYLPSIAFGVAFLPSTYSKPPKQNNVTAKTPLYTIIIPRTSQLSRTKIEPRLLSCKHHALIPQQNPYEYRSFFASSPWLTNTRNISAAQISLAHTYSNPELVRCTMHDTLLLARSPRETYHTLHTINCSPRHASFPAGRV